MSDCDSDDTSINGTVFNVRVKDETPEQKRERKRLFKEAKRVCAWIHFSQYIVFRH